MGNSAPATKIIPNTVPKPPPFFCQKSSNQTRKDLIKLEACDNTLECYIKMQKYNDDVSAYNMGQNRAYEQHLTIYNENKKKYDDAMALWEDARKKKKAELEGDRQYGTCKAAGACSASSCYGNWESDNSTRKCNISGAPTGCQIGCKRQEIFINQLMAEWDIQNPVPTFSEIKPEKDVHYPDTEQNLSQGTIQCCSNYIDGWGTFTNNIQECKQTVKSLIDMTASTNTIIDLSTTKNTSEESDIVKKENFSTMSHQKCLSDCDIIWIIFGVVILFIVFRIMIGMFSDFSVSHYNLSTI
jgi:hypothetical protein